MSSFLLNSHASVPAKVYIVFGKKCLQLYRFRSTNNNLQDYVPLYRYLPQNERTKLAIANRVKRDEIFAQLLNKVAKAVEEGKPVDCISSGLLTEKGRLTDGK